MKFIKSLFIGLFALCWVSFCSATQILCEDFDLDDLDWDSWSIEVIWQDDCYKDWSIDNDNILVLISVNSIENTEDWEFTIWDWYIYSNDSTNYSYWILTSYRSLTLDFYSEVSKVYTLSWRILTNNNFYSIFNNGYSTCPLSNWSVNSLLGSWVVVKSKTWIVWNPQSQANWNTMYKLSDFGVSEGTICFRVNTFETRKTSSVYLYFWFSNANAIPSNRFQYWQNTTGSWVCVYWNKPELRFALYQNTSDTYTGYIETEAFLLSDLLNYGISTPSCPTCPDQYSSLECQSEYSLIPISSVDSNYCTTNWLCPSSWGGDCWTWSINWSSLFINDIQHLWKPIITIDIPEEINWDYTSTDTEFSVEVIGYNVDYEKMNQVLSIQKYIPSSEDFTQVVWILAPYMKILVFVLFVYIVIRRLKKPFSSKMK